MNWRVEAELSGRELLLLEGGVILLLVAGVLFSLVQVQVAALLIAMSVSLYLFNAPLRHQLNLIFLVMMFDFHRMVGGTWVYLDLTFGTLALPLLRRTRLPPFWWVFVPYTLFLLVDGIPRALVPAWYAGFALRSVFAVLVYMACCIADVEQSYIMILGCTMIPLTIYGAYQLWLGDFGALFAWLNPHMDMPWTGRAYSLLWQPNSYGGVCSLAIVSFAALAMKGVRARLMYFFIAVTGIGLICSGSRGALIATFCGISFAAFVAGRKKLILMPIVVAALILATGNLLDITALQRLGHGDRVSNEGRALGNALGIRSFLENPVIGVGPTNFEKILPTMHEWGYSNAMPVNNIYLQHLAELGIVGFAAFWVPLSVLAWAGWKRRDDPMILAGMCSLVAFAVHGLFDYLWEFGPPYLFLFYAACGLMAGRIARLQRLEDGELHESTSTVCVVRQESHA